MRRLRPIRPQTLGGICDVRSYPRKVSWRGELSDIYFELHVGRFIVRGISSSGNTSEVDL